VINVRAKPLRRQPSAREGSGVDVIDPATAGNWKATGEGIKVQVEPQR
jgi:hypothetical protein